VNAARSMILESIIVVSCCRLSPSVLYHFVIIIDQRRVDVLPTTIKKCLPKENVCVSVCLCVTSHSYLGTYVLTPYVCSDTLSRH